MFNTPFKKSRISEMTKQIVSAPVIFRLKDGTECLAFYNHEDSIQATKLYILFPDTNFPKYIEGNDLYTLRECIIHGITREKAALLYSKFKSHKTDTKTLISTLIAKAPASQEVLAPVVPSINTTTGVHNVYNKKYACAIVEYRGNKVTVFVSNLKDKTALELIINGNIYYNVTLDSVYWAAGISAKEYTNLKETLRKL